MNLYKVLVPSVKGRRTLVPYNEDFYFNNFKPRPTALYESIYIYTDEHKKILEETGSLSGITGLMTDKVVFDFDSNRKPELALEDARELVFRLLEVFGENKSAIRCFFSGNKGYHVEVHFDNEYINREQFEKIIFHFAGDLETFDISVKDEQRVFRFPLSKHEKTGLYKLPILVDNFTDETNSHSVFVNEAKRPNDNYAEILASFRRVPIPMQFKDIPTEPTKKATVEVVTEYPDMTHKPKHFTPAKYALSMGFFDEGESHDACMRICAALRFANFTKDQAYGLLKCAINRRNARLGLDKIDDEKKQELWNNVINSVYSNSWTGATYSDATDPLLLKTIEKYGLERFYSEMSSEVLNIAEVGEIFLKFTDNIDNNIIKTGLADLDKEILLTSSMMVGILGAPSSGKTGFTVKVMEHQSISNIDSFFVSADMSPQLLYASLMRSYCKKSFMQILDTTKKVPLVSWPKDMKNAWDIVQENFKNVGLCFKSGPTIEDIKNNIDAHEQRTGRAVRFLGVDYLEKILSKFSDPNASSGYNAARLADFTRDKNLTTFLLLQTQKASGDPSHELTSMRNIKGASVIEQDCRVVLTTWRPGFNPDVKGRNPDDKFVSFACVKNNMGNTGRFDFYVDPDSGLYRNINEEELLDFERVKQESIARRLARMSGNFAPKPASAPRPATPNRFVPKEDKSQTKELY